MFHVQEFFKFMRVMKMIKKTALYLISCTLLVACNGYDDKPDQPTTPQPKTEFAVPALRLQTNFLNQDAILATGLDIKTGKPVVLGTVKGENIEPCSDSTIFASTETGNTDSKEVYSEPAEKTRNDKDQDCIKVVNPSADLKSVLNSTRSIIDGTVIKDGEIKPAKFIVQVSALFEGSDCITHYVGGVQYADGLCVKETQNCQDKYQANLLLIDLAGLCPDCSEEEKMEMAINSLNSKCKEVVTQ